MPARPSKLLASALAVAVAAVVAVAASACSDPAPAPASNTAALAPAPRPAPTAAATSPADADPARAATPWALEALSADGSRVLLRQVTAPGAPTSWTVVATATGNVLATAGVTTFESTRKALASATGDGVPAALSAPAFEAELAAAAKLVEAFPFGAVEAMAASADRVVFAAGDALWLADRAGRVKARVAKPAAYTPMFAPDGGAFFYRTQSGTLAGGLSKYELFATSFGPADAPAPKPARVEHSAQMVGTARLAADGKAMRAVVSRAPEIPSCVIEVALAPPHASRKVACLTGAADLADAQLSPRGAWAAFTTHPDPAGPKPDAGAPYALRLRVVRVDDGAVVYDQPRAAGSVVAVSDQGLVVVAPANADPFVIDAPNATTWPAPASLTRALTGRFRSATEVVLVEGAGVKLVDVATR